MSAINKILNNLFGIQQIKRISIFRLSFILVVPVILLIIFISLSAPAKTLSYLNNKYGSDTSGTDKSIQVLQQPEIFRLKKEESFLKSRLMMAASDSISLAVDLQDSLVTLELRGVVIHRARIQNIAYSNILKKMNKDALINLFAAPFIIEQNNATIPKESFIIKEAPKDTSEANSLAMLTDTVQKNTVCLFSTLDKGLTIDMRQYEIPKGKKYTGYVLKNKINQAGLLFRDVFRLKVPEYHPWIKIELSAKDIRAIYRSSPQKPLVSVKI